MNNQVKWTAHPDEWGFIEFRYQCECGKKYFDVYINKGEIVETDKACKHCKRFIVIPTMSTAPLRHWW